MMDDMALPEHDQKNVDAYFAALKAVEPAVKHDWLSYLAVRHEGEFILLQASLQRHILKPSFVDTLVSTQNIRAGRCLLKDIGLTPRKLVDALFAGSIKVHNTELKFPGDYSNARSTYFAPFWPPALQMQSRTNALQISGGQQASFIRQPMLDWELRASPTPYENLQELAYQFQLGALQGNGAVNVLMLAYPAAFIDDASRVHGEKADVGIRLFPGLKKKDVAIGIRVLKPDGSIERMQIAGCDLKWTKLPTFNLGTTQIQVPKAAALQCFAVYGGDTQNSYWVTDPSTAHNTRRVALQAYDAQLGKLKEMLFRDTYRGPEARDFEAAISWLFWMLGFSVAHLSATKTSDGPDIIATSPNGNLAVVECTTGLLKTDNKLPNLYERAQAMRKSLEMSGNNAVRVLPIMVTAKSRNDVATELEQAERHGVLVFTREDIESALNGTLVLPNAEQIFTNWQQAANSALAKYTSQGGLPPGN